MPKTYRRSPWRLLALTCLLCVPGARVHAAAITVVDDLGRRITLPQRPQRIVSLAPSVTEILFAVGGGARVVADTSYCDYPSAAQKLPHVGGPMDPSAERIIAAHPDLIVIASQTLPRAEADRLSGRWRCPVFVTAAASYAGTMKNVRVLGALAGEPAATRKCLDSMNGALTYVRKNIVGRPRPRAFVVVWQVPLMTATGSSFIGDLVKLAGGVNVAEKTPGAYPRYSAEWLVRDDPEVVLVGTDSAASGKLPDISSPADARLREYLSRAKPSPIHAAWRNTVLAVRAGRVRGIPGDWTGRPGPRLALGLVAMAMALHLDFGTAQTAGRPPSR